MSTEQDFGDDFEATGVDARDLKAELEKAELDDKVAADEAAAAKALEDEAAEKAAAEAKAKAMIEKKPEEEEVKTETKEEEEKERSKVIPRERFDAAQKKAKERELALHKQIEDLQKHTVAQQVSTDTKKLQGAIDTLQDQYEDALLDGKKAEAKAIRQELFRLQDAMIEVKTNVSSEAAKRETISELKYDAALAKAESEHPELNPDSDEYDETLTDEVGVLLEAFVLRGFNRDAALQKAVKYVVGDAPKKDLDNTDPKKLVKEREEAARRKAAEAAKKQPPATTKTGLDTDKAGQKGDVKDIDIMRISQERFAKLDEEQLARMRGDIL